MSNTTTEQDYLASLVESGKLLHTVDPALSISVMTNFHTDMRNAGVDEAKARDYFFKAAATQHDYIIWQQKSEGIGNSWSGNDILGLATVVLRHYTQPTKEVTGTSLKA